MTLSSIVKKTLQGKKLRSLPGGVSKKVRLQYSSAKRRVINIFDLIKKPSVKLALNGVAVRRHLAIVSLTEYAKLLFDGKNSESRLLGIRVLGCAASKSPSTTHVDLFKKTFVKAPTKTQREIIQKLTFTFSNSMLRDSSLNVRLAALDNLAMLGDLRSRKLFESILAGNTEITFGLSYEGLFFSTKGLTGRQKAQRVFEEEKRELMGLAKEGLANIELNKK